MRGAVPAVALVIMAGCADGGSEDFFALPADAGLHQYVDGDLIEFQVFGDRVDAGGTNTVLGDRRVAWLTAVATNPDDATLSFLEQTERTLFASGGEFEVRYYVNQDNQGHLRLYGIGDITGSQVAWLLPDGDNQFVGATMLFSPLNSDLNDSVQISGSLFDCSSGSCSQNIGSYTYALTRQGVETVSTPRGDFEAYRFSLQESINTGNSNTYPSLSRTGTVWVYPPVGVVQATMDVVILDGSGTSYFLDDIDITSTNITLPEPG